MTSRFLALLVMICAFGENNSSTQYIKQNINLTAIPNDIPTGIWKLVLSNNIISNIDKHNFEYLTSVTYLDLQNNHISNIPANTFQNMTILASLYLSNNNITTLTKASRSFRKKETGIIDDS